MNHVLHTLHGLMILAMKIKKMFLKLGICGKIH
jgi:hypothetical protein